MGEKSQNPTFLVKNRVLVPVPMKQWASGTGTTQLEPVPIGSKGLVPVPLLPTTLFFHIFASLSFVLVYRLFRDPKKRLIGVQIRMRLSEKRTVPHRLGEANV